MSFLSRLANVCRSGRVTDDLDDELRFHLEATAERLVAEGMSPESARREAARRLGNAASLRERSRDVKLLPWLDAVMRDIGFGLRMLRKDRGVTTSVVASLGLAMGACAAAFMLVDALILRPLGVPEPERLVYLALPPDTPTSPDGEPRREGQSFSYPLYERFREAAGRRAELMVLGYQRSELARFFDASDRRERVRAQHVSGNVFGELGVVPALGRLITTDDDRVGAPRRVVVLGHAFWIRRFGGDARVLGRHLAFDRDHQYEIVGVAREGFTGVEPGMRTDLWLPAASYEAAAFTSPGWQWFRVMGRLREGVTREELQSRLQPVFRQFRAERVGRRPADTPRADNERYVNQPLAVQPGAQGPSALRAEFEQPLLVLAAVVGLVLLLACSNVANLLLARATAREREMALRLSIGAGRSRLVQQLLIEGALLAAAAVLVAVVTASAAAPAVVHWLAPADSPAYLDLRLDGRFAGFLVLIALASALAFGLVPAWRASAISPIAALKTGGRSGTRPRLLHPLLAAQVACSVAVLSVAALLLVSFDRLASVHPGFRADGLLLASVEPVDRVEGLAGRQALLQALDLSRAIPGIESASASAWPLMSGAGWITDIRLPGGQLDGRAVNFLEVTSGFMRAMSIPLLQGRDLSAADGRSAEPAAVLVNEAFARTYFAGLSPVGRTFERPDAAVVHEIVGVVGDAKYQTLREQVLPTVYLPMRGRRDGGVIQLRTGLPMEAIGPLLQGELAKVSPPVVLTGLEPQVTLVTNTMLRERLLALLSVFFGTVSLALAAVGLYGVLTFSVLQRTREIGIRRVLGAGSWTAASRVLRDAALYGTIGVLAGAAAGIYGRRLVATLLYEVRPLDPASLLLSVAALLVVGAIAAVVPARRATAVAPVDALRDD